MVKLLQIIILISGLCIAKLAAAENSKFAAFVGTGVGYSWPKVYRISWEDTEIGTYSSALGVEKIFMKNDLYAGFGWGLSLQGSADLGIMGSVGWYKKWKWIGFRVDWTSFASLSSYMSTDLTLGPTIQF